MWYIKGFCWPISVEFTQEKSWKPWDVIELKQIETESQQIFQWKLKFFHFLNPFFPALRDKTRKKISTSSTEECKSINNGWQSDENCRKTTTWQFTLLSHFIYRPRGIKAFFFRAFFPENVFVCLFYPPFVNQHPHTLGLT